VTFGNQSPVPGHPDLDPSHSHLTHLQVRLGNMAPPTDSISTVIAKLEELGRKVDNVDRKTDETNQKIEEMQSSIQQIKDEHTSVNTWKPELENKVSDLQNSVFLLKQKVDLLIHESPKPITVEGIVSGVPTPAQLGVTADAETPGPDGHRVDNHHRSAGARVVTTLVPTPVTGADRFSNFSPVPFRGFGSVGSVPYSCSSSAIPQLEFPKFDGSYPKIWMKKCEGYFDIYETPPEYWVKLATMNFSGPAAFWMQSIEMDVRKCD